MHTHARAHASLARTHRHARSRPNRAGYTRSCLFLAVHRRAPTDIYRVISILLSEQCICLWGRKVFDKRERRRRMPAERILRVPFLFFPLLPFLRFAASTAAALFPLSLSLLFLLFPPLMHMYGRTRTIAPAGYKHLPIMLARLRPTTVHRRRVRVCSVVCEAGPLNSNGGGGIFIAKGAAASVYDPR